MRKRQEPHVSGVRAEERQEIREMNPCELMRCPNCMTWQHSIYPKCPKCGHGAGDTRFVERSVVTKNGKPLDHSAPKREYKAAHNKGKHLPHTQKRIDRLREVVAELDPDRIYTRTDIHEMMCGKEGFDDMPAQTVSYIVNVTGLLERISPGQYRIPKPLKESEDD